MKKIISIIIFSVSIYANLLSQCFPDRHNTTWYDGWISCEISPNPNPQRGESHWILYNFSYRYDLGQMHVWNSNAEAYLEDGMKEVAIDVSDDGIHWTEVGNFQFEKADGSSTYEGFDGPDLEGYPARYLLVTGLSNWGGYCYSLSEIRIEVLGVSPVSELPPSQCLSVKISPNPVTPYSKAIISSSCSNAAIDFSIQDIAGRIIRTGTITPVANQAAVDLDIGGLQAGSYIFSLNQNGLVLKQKFIAL